MREFTHVWVKCMGFATIANTRSFGAETWQMMTWFYGNMAASLSIILY